MKVDDIKPGRTYRNRKGNLERRVCFAGPVSFCVDIVKGRGPYTGGGVERLDTDRYLIERHKFAAWAHHEVPEARTSAAGKLARLCESARPPTLKKLAAFVNDEIAGYSATARASWSSTDRKIPGTRLRSPGRGRSGYRLVIVRDSDGLIVLDHDGSQTYRTNGEAVEGVAKIAGDGRPERYATRWLGRSRSQIRREHEGRKGR